MRRLLFLLLLLFPFAANASCPATLSDCGNINVNNGNFNEIVVGPAAGGPQGPGTINTHGGIFQDGVPFSGGGGPTFTNGIIIPNSIYYAKNFGSCTWDATHDVGACIQLAINAAGANVGGGTVVVPNGTYGLATPLTITTQNTSLRASGYGMVSRTNVGGTVPTSTVIFKWLGTSISPGSTQQYMITVAPLIVNGKVLIGANVQGFYFDCQGVQGCSGGLVASVWHSNFDVGAKEPRGVPYTASVLTSGSQTITVSSTAGFVLGQPVMATDLPHGAYLAAIVDGTHIKASIQASASNTETVTIGGEGFRFDVVDQLPDSNSTLDVTVNFEGYNLGAGVNASAGLLFIGGSGVVGNTHGNFGNTNSSHFNRVDCWFNNGACLVVNNADHNDFALPGLIDSANVGGGNGEFILCNGTLDNTHDGACRFARFGYIGGAGPIVFAGTDTGGFTNAAIGNIIYYLTLQNGGQHPTIGVAATLCYTAENQMSIGCVGGQPLQAQLNDGTIVGGNARGAYAVDLQLSRSNANQVASVVNATIGGGDSNIANGLVCTIPGGEANICSGTGSFAAGQAAQADLYAVYCFSSGIISSGRRAQTCTQILRQRSAGGTAPQAAIKLTSDELALGVNNSANPTIGGSIFNLSSRCSAVDSVALINGWTWTEPMSAIIRPSNAVSALFTAGTPLTPISFGTTTGIGMAKSEDTSFANPAYVLTFTPPSASTNIWDVSCAVTWTRTD